MRFLKSTRPLSAEDEHAVARLNALAHRVRTSCTDRPLELSERVEASDAANPLDVRDVLQ